MDFQRQTHDLIAGGQAPDIAYIDQFWSPQLARTGAIVKMQDFIEGPNGIDHDDIVPIAGDCHS